MSRSRKFGKQTLFSIQQKYLHRSQQKKGIMKKSAAFRLRTGIFNTQSFWFWFFFLNLLADSVGKMVPNNGNHKKQSNEKSKEISNLAKSRMAYASGLSEKEMHSGVCDRIADRIGVLASVNDAFEEAMRFVFQQGSFKIACASSSVLYKLYTVFAYFIPTSNSVVIAYDMINSNGLAHEFIHAMQHAIHSPESHCHIPAESLLSVMPVYPVTADNLKKFNDCMDLGDQRVYKLYDLMLKERKGIKLFNDEKYKLLRAKKELEGTIPASSILDLPLDQIQLLKNVGWPSIKNFFLTLSDGRELFVKNVVINPESIRVFYRIDDAITSVYDSIIQFKRINAEGYYSKKEEVTAERLAFSLQCLTIKGRKYLYPEADQFLKEQREACMPSKKIEL